MLYHCGASLKDLGKKCFAISKIEDVEYIKKFVKLDNKRGSSNGTSIVAL